MMITLNLDKSDSKAKKIEININSKKKKSNRNKKPGKTKRDKKNRKLHHVFILPANCIQPPLQPHHHKVFARLVHGCQLKPRVKAGEGMGLINI